MKKWFVYDPEGNGYEEFNSEKDALTRAKVCIEDYLDEGWSEDVEYVTVGLVTYRATQCNITKRPPENELDDENIDREGTYWSEGWDHMCNYDMKAVK